MDPMRKDLMAAGLYLGDVTLALAALAGELPSYVQGFDVEKVIPDDEGLRRAREEIDALTGGGEPAKREEPGKREEPRELPAELTRKILDRAIEEGKFLSASRCLDLLGGREEMVDGFLAGAAEKLAAGDAAGAARDLVVASNLGSDTVFPLFQYLGPDMHDACAASPGECITRAPADDAVARALRYLLEGDKVAALVDGLSPEARKRLLPHVAAERDAHLREFYAAYERAQETLRRILEEDLARVGEDLGRAAATIAGAAKALSGARPADSGARPVESADRLSLERAKRVMAGLSKDFEDIQALVADLQLKRLKRRLSNLLESEDELAGAGAEAGPVAGLIAGFREKDLAGRIDRIEAGLMGLQVGMLGRPVHSQEHWQYLRELAFKYPVSPLMCCIRRLDDRYMVVPRWDGEVTAMIREFVQALPGSASGEPG